jgi:hypothetical protein
MGCVRHVSRIVLSLGILAMFSGAAPAAVIGKAVVTADQAPIMQGGKTIATAKKGDTFDVTGANGDWFGLSPSQGWIHKANVRYEPAPPQKVGGEIAAFAQESILFARLAGVYPVKTFQPDTAKPDTGKTFLIVVAPAAVLGAHNLVALGDVKLRLASDDNPLLRGVGFGLGMSHVDSLSKGTFLFGMPPEQMGMAEPGFLILAYETAAECTPPISVSYNGKTYQGKLITREEWRRQAQQQGQRKSLSIIVVKGVLVDARGQPVPRKGIRILDAEGNLILEKNEKGFYVVGIAETDEKGAFKVEISRDLPKVYREFHLCCLTVISLIPPKSRFTKLMDDKGVPIVIKADTPDAEIDLGRIVLKEE